MPSLALPKYAEQPTSRALIRYGEVALMYLVLIFTLPGNREYMAAHNLTTQEYHVLQLVVGLPLLLIWLVGFYGYAKLEEYAASISKTSEAAGFERLAQGCAWVAWSLPVHAIVSVVISSVAGSHPGLESAAIIIGNYVNLIFPVIAFSLIGLASKHLFEHAKASLSSSSIRSIALLFVVGGVLYCYLIFRQFGHPGLSSVSNPYHLPIWVMVLTVIIPYLYAWFAGILAVYELAMYGRGVRGVLYRQSMQLLVGGLFAVIFGSIAYQYVHSVQPAASPLALNAQLVVTLVLQIVSGFGFLLISLGALRLRKIEEV